jgi:hypothetical protein
MNLYKRFRLRHAAPSDLSSILKIKEALKISRIEHKQTSEGFLLGSSPEFYLEMIEHGIAQVVEDQTDSIVYGVGFALPWDMLKLTEVWQKRKLATWHGSLLNDLEEGKPGYIEQLAVLPGQSLRFLAPGLGLSLVEQLFTHGHTHILATTVLEPVKNTAAIKLLRLIHAFPAGEIEEQYPKIGRILSQIHCVSLHAYKKASAEDSFQSRVLGYLEKTSNFRQEL